MKLKVQRYMKPNTTTHVGRILLIHGEPRPGLYDFMLDRKLVDLARLWSQLDGRFSDERLDSNAALAADVKGWKDVTLRDLSKPSGFEFEGDPLTAAVIEEAVRRALKMLFIMGDYAERYAKQEEDFELGTPEAEPTGLAAISPTRKE